MHLNSSFCTAIAKLVLNGESVSAIARKIREAVGPAAWDGVAKGDKTFNRIRANVNIVKMAVEKGRLDVEAFEKMDARAKERFFKYGYASTKLSGCGRVMLDSQERLEKKFITTSWKCGKPTRLSIEWLFLSRYLWKIQHSREGQHQRDT